MQNYKSVQYIIDNESQIINVFGSIDDLVSLVEKIEVSRRKTSNPYSKYDLAGFVEMVKAYERGETSLDEVSREAQNTQRTFGILHRTKFTLDEKTLREEEGILKADIFLRYFPNNRGFYECELPPGSPKIKERYDADFKEIISTFEAALKLL